MTHVPAHLMVVVDKILTFATTLHCHLSNTCRVKAASLDVVMGTNSHTGVASQKCSHV